MYCFIGIDGQRAIFPKCKYIRDIILILKLFEKFCW